MQKGILNGLKSLNWEFWRDFRKNPIGYFSIAFLIVLVFVYDLAFELLAPARIKAQREAMWAEIEREEMEKIKREKKEVEEK